MSSADAHPPAPAPAWARTSLARGSTFLACWLCWLGLASCTDRGGRLRAELPDQILLEPDGAAAITEATDSVALRATDMYEVGGLRRFLFGRRYREAWAAPVTVPVAWLDEYRGGLRLDDRGGGFQTLSVDVIGPDETVYTLRSVAKNPTRLIKPWMRFTGLDNLVIDGISAGHPYGAMVMPALSEAAGVAHFAPELVFVPKQPALDTLNEQFGDHLFWLEYEPEDDVPAQVAAIAGLDTNAYDIEDFDDSEKVLEKWRGDPEGHRPDLRALARARVFDLWLGDWDRHDGQWGWIQYEDGEVHRYHPVPNDRDNVFYGLDGVSAAVVRAFEKRVQKFGPRIKNVKGLTSNSAYFDYSFLYDLPEEVFVEEARDLQVALTDEVIEAAIRQWPPAVFAADGERIIAHLKERRGDLVRYAREFHRVIRERGVVEDREEA